MTQTETLRNNEMNALRANGWTLQEIADKYGISRGRVCRIVGRTGFTATRSDKKKRLSIFETIKHLSNSKVSELLGITKRCVAHEYRNGERHEIDGGTCQIGAKAEEEVSEKLMSLGIKHQLMPHNHIFDILLDNGKKIDVKSSNPLSTVTKTPLYSFNAKTKKKGNYCDFLILYLRDVKEYFIIPIKDAGNTIHFRFPDPNRGKKSKWHKYHNRFDLIERQPTNPTPAR